MGYLLDTNILVGLLRKNPSIVDRYTKINNPTTSIAITVYTIAELYYGLYNNKKKNYAAEEQKILELMLDQFQKRDQIRAMSRQAAILYANYDFALETQGTPIPVMDLLIGVVAIAENLTLLTIDQTHFEQLQKVASEFQVEFWKK